MARGKRIGYVLRKFPVLSETFILNEMLALEARGARLHVFSLDRPNDPRFHEDLPRLKARVAYVPDVFESKRLLEHGSRLRSEEHTSELQSQSNLVCRLLLE